MLKAGDSKELWLSIRRSMDDYDIRLGQATAQGYVHDPRMIAFIASRYKFASKMLEGRDYVLEVGCGDAFGAPIVAQTVTNLVCADIDQETLGRNRRRCEPFRNIEFRYHDFRVDRMAGDFQAVYLIDVIEHIYSHEEPFFMANIAASLCRDGFILIGTPNATAEKYASKHSNAGHVNLKSHHTLRELGLEHFHNVFMFGQNDEVVHTGFAPMCNYLWMLGVRPRR